MTSDAWTYLKMLEGKTLHTDHVAVCGQVVAPKPYAFCLGRQAARLPPQCSADRSTQVKRPQRSPKDFLDTYPGSTVDQIDRTNYWRYLMAPG